MNPNLTLQSAYVLHTRAYQESSLIVELLTVDGRMSVVAKGAKRPKSSYRGILQPFIPLTLSYVGRSELKTLTYAEALSLPLLQGDHLLAGFYVNELLMRLLLKESPCGQVFVAYETILTALRAQQDLWVCLRLFEKALLKALGYELNLSYDAHTGEHIEHCAEYVYLLEQGPVRLAQAVNQDKNYIFSGKSLLALAEDDLQDPHVRKQAKQLLQQALQVHLGPRPLCSRDLFLNV